MMQIQNIKCYKVENNFQKLLPMFLLKLIVKPTTYKECYLKNINILDVEGSDDPQKIILELSYEEVDEDE